MFPAGVKVEQTNGCMGACARVNADNWQKEKGDSRGRSCQRSDQPKYKKPKTMSEAVQRQMVFCSTDGARTIEAMVERLERDEGDFTTD